MGLRHDPDLAYVQHVLDTDTPWLARHATDLHELAYGQAGSNPEIIVQTHNDTDLSNHIDTPTQDLWNELVNLCRRLEATKTHTQRAFNRGRPDAEYRPPRRLVKDDEYDRNQLRAALARRRQDPDMYSPVPLNPETGL